jgi:hypothetical protein
MSNYLGKDGETGDVKEMYKDLGYRHEILN